MQFLYGFGMVFGLGLFSGLQEGATLEGLGM